MPSLLRAQRAEAKSLACVAASKDMPWLQELCDSAAWKVCEERLSQPLPLTLRISEANPLEVATRATVADLFAGALMPTGWLPRECAWQAAMVRHSVTSADCGGPPLAGNLPILHDILGMQT